MLARSSSATFPSVDSVRGMNPRATNGEPGSVTAYAVQGDLSLYGQERSSCWAVSFLRLVTEPSWVWAELVSREENQDQPRLSCHRF
jgi:hypothetical protein